MGKQKIVMKLTMEDEKKRSKALKTAVGRHGVISAAVDGKDKDQIVVVGDDVDSVALTSKMRKKMGHVDLVSVAPVEEKKEESKSDSEKNTAPPYYVGVVHPQVYEISQAGYDNNCCSIM